MYFLPGFAAETCGSPESRAAAVRNYFCIFSIFSIYFCFAAIISYMLQKV